MHQITPPWSSVETVRRFLTAYCDKDFETLSGLLHPEFAFTHHRFGHRHDTTEAFLEMVTTLARDIAPDRRYADIRSVSAYGDVVVVNSVWQGTFVADRPGKSEKGKVLTLELTTTYRIKDDLVIEMREF